MSVTKKPQAKAPTIRNTKSIQSITFCGRTKYLFSQKPTLGTARVTVVTQVVKMAK
jgi:hypothetical protein